MQLTQDDVIRILKLIDESPMGRVSLQLGEFKLEVIKGDAVSQPKKAKEPARPKEAPKEAPKAKEPAAAKPAEAAEPGLLQVKAPLLGTFYRRSQPGQPPYVEEGSLVDEDTTVALIEVMKLFNPVKAGVKGRIHRICVPDNELVEYGQLLFLVKPE